MQTMHLGTNNHGHKLQAITHMNEKTQNLEAQRKNQWCIHDLRTQNNWHWLQVANTHEWKNSKPISAKEKSRMHLWLKDLKPLILTIGWTHMNEGTGNL